MKATKQPKSASDVDLDNLRPDQIADNCINMLANMMLYREGLVTAYERRCYVNAFIPLIKELHGEIKERYELFTEVMEIVQHSLRQVESTQLDDGSGEYTEEIKELIDKFKELVEKERG